MNTNYDAPFTPATITANNKILNIPIYQRLFVWGEEQINLLLYDLWNAADATSKGPQKPYYIGIITVVENNGGWDVVDGQQRLTFLSLFGAFACSRGFKAWNSFLYRDNSKCEKESLRINYIGRPEDRDFLQAIADNKESEVKNSNFVKFVECIKPYSEKEGFKQFVDYVYNNTSFLVSELPNNYLPQDLNSFFEKMNSTGRQLTPVEQIKGKYFPVHAAEFDACLNFETKYAKPTPDEQKQANDISNETIISILGSTIDVMDEKNDDHPTEEKSRSVLAPEIFLLHSLAIALKKKEKDFKVSQEKRSILKTFSDTVGTGTTIAPEELLETMEQYREWIDSNIIYLNNNGTSLDYKFWTQSKDEKQEEEDVESSETKKLKQFQSMLYVSSDEWQGWVLKAYFDCLSGIPFDLALLKKQDNERHKLPQDLSLLSYGAIDRYWFWKLDYVLWESVFCGASIVDIEEEYKNAVINYIFRRNRSIEHLHPQTDGLPNENKWNQPINCEGLFLSKSPKDWFGNLAMISSGFNSAQSNDSVGVKFARLRDSQIPQKSLESIKMLLMFLIAGGNENGWTPVVSVKHGKAMYELLKSYYDSNSDTKE